MLFTAALKTANPTFADTAGIPLFQGINARNANYKSQSTMNCVIIGVNCVAVSLCLQYY